MFIASIIALLMHTCGLITQLCVLLGNSSIERCIVSLELDRVGLGYRMSGHGVRLFSVNYAMIIMLFH